MKTLNKPKSITNIANDTSRKTSLKHIVKCSNLNITSKLKNSSETQYISEYIVRSEPITSTRVDNLNKQNTKMNGSYFKEPSSNLK